MKMSDYLNKLMKSCHSFLDKYTLWMAKQLSEVKFLLVDIGLTSVSKALDIVTLLSVSLRLGGRLK
jgi:hypothetical protein